MTVTHPDITRFFMTIPEACRLVMEAATMSTGNQIFVFDMGESVKIAHLARRMISLAGFEPEKDIRIEYTGLRPGEKLYEEVLSNKENTEPTLHDRIRIAKVREYDYREACEVAEELETLSRKVEIPDMVRLMKRQFPSSNQRTQGLRCMINRVSLHTFCERLKSSDLFKDSFWALAGSALGKVFLYLQELP